MLFSNVGGSAVVSSNKVQPSSGTTSPLPPSPALEDRVIQGQTSSPVETVTRALLMPVWIVGTEAQRGKLSPKLQRKCFLQKLKLGICSSIRGSRTALHGVRVGVAAEALLMVSGLWAFSPFRIAFTFGALLDPLVLTHGLSSLPFDGPQMGNSLTEELRDRRER